MRRFVCCCIALALLLTFSAVANAAGFAPDPLSVQREGPAYRYPQAGWIVLHIEGDPYDRGRQHGKLLWHEIADYIKCYAAMQSSKSPADGWQLTRTLADALFVRRFDPELLEEMKGIADGAAAGGAKFDGRPVDLTDIVAINVWPEIMTLDDALRAQPTGLEGKVFEKQAARVVAEKAEHKPDRCSAFAATGSATADGKAIIGHITMFELYPCNFFNVWIDVKPTRGHRVVIQGAPGSVQSGMDWYLNDAGIVLTETTIEQTTYEPTGMSVGSRSRHAMQYGDSIDSVVKILGFQNNGLYSNEWLLADMKSNEIALFELGTKATCLMRSSKNQWFGGTDGFYWGCNNTKDLAVRLETIAATNDRPANMTFVPEERDMAWIKLYREHKGKIDASFGKLAFGKPPLASRNSCDAKYTTADMALKLQSFAHWADPYGQLWEPSKDERERFPEIAPLVPSDWTVLTTDPPPALHEGSPMAVDLNPTDGGGGDEGDDSHRAPAPLAWHGTILPATDGDIWLTSAFAKFQDYVARERQMLRDNEGGNAKNKSAGGSAELTADQHDQLAVALFEFRTWALGPGSITGATPLRKVVADPSQDAWFLAASGRGAMLLAELRRRVGADRFDEAMDAFGRAHAGKAADSAAFVAAMSALDKSNLNDFFARWLDSTDALPTLTLGPVSSDQKEGTYAVTGEIASHNGCPPANVDVTLETEDGETTTAVPFESGNAKFRLTSEHKPTRLIVNKYGQTPIANGWNWAGYAFMHDLVHSIIVYGTRHDAVANRIAAEKLQKGIVNKWQHAIIRVEPDSNVSEEDLRSHHVLLIAPPGSCDLADRLDSSLPVTFGPHSFVARGQNYASADSAVIATAANPLNARYSIVRVAGLSPASTLRAAEALPEHVPTPLKIFPARGKSKDLVPYPPELAHNFN